MKKETFKISAIFLAILMCFSVISISASAETPVSTRSKGSFGFQVRYFDGYSSGEQIAGWMPAGKITDGSGSFKIATNSGASYFSGYGMKGKFALLEGYNFQQLTVEGGAFPLITTGADNTARYLSIRYMILSSEATEVGFTYQYKIGGDSVKTPFEAVKVGEWSVTTIAVNDPSLWGSGQVPGGNVSQDGVGYLYVKGLNSGDEYVIDYIGSFNSQESADAEAARQSEFWEQLTKVKPYRTSGKNASFIRYFDFLQKTGDFYPITDENGVGGVHNSAPVDPTESGYGMNVTIGSGTATIPLAGGTLCKLFATENSDSRYLSIRFKVSNGTKNSIRFSLQEQENDDYLVMDGVSYENDKWSLVTIDTTQGKNWSRNAVVSEGYLDVSKLAYLYVSGLNEGATVTLDYIGYFKTEAKASAEVFRQDNEENGMISFLGVQPKKESGAIRLVGILNAELEDFSEIGFHVTAKVNGTEKKFVTPTDKSNLVYTSIQAYNPKTQSTETITAESKGGKYFFTLVIDKIPTELTDITIEVSCFATSATGLTVLSLSHGIFTFNPSTNEILK